MSREDENRRWQPPSRLAPGKKRGSYIQEIINDGERWIESQPWWNDLEKAENMIRGKEMCAADQNRSSLTSNRLKRISREMVAAISDVRYPDAWSSDNKAYANEASMLSKVAKGVWFESRANLSIRHLAQWMLLGGNGNIWPVFRRRIIADPYSTAICFDVYGPRDVIPFMPSSDPRGQSDYARTMVRMVPVPEAHARFPMFQDKLRPVSRKRQASNAVSARMAFIDSMRGTNRSTPWSEQLCELRYTLIRDLSINDTDMPIPMGDAGASWSYVVPALGADMPSDDVEKDGSRIMRPATIDDCRLYPNMRLIVTGSGVDEPMYDGPAWDWHGMMPPRFYADDWVTECTGLSLIRDVLDQERARQFTERAVDMKIKAQCDPALMYDQNVINSGTAEELDPWEMRKRLGVDGDVTKVLQTIIPAEMMKVGGEPFEWLKYLSESQDEQLGVNQMTALSKAKMSTSEGADDLLKIAGPIVRDISASMEAPMADVLEMVKYQILQFMPVSRVMTYVGADGITPETFDFEPNNVVPSHMPGEDATGTSRFSRMERAKAFARNLRLQIAPGSVHGLSQTQQKLMLQQGYRAGLPIPPRLIMEKCYGLENWEGLFKEWTDFKRMELEFAASLKKEGTALQPSQPPPSAGGTPGGAQGGRPPSGSKPPAAKTKGSASGPRAVVSQSG